MAYTTLSTKRWTQGDPQINITYAYERARSGADMVYSFRISVSAVTGARYFGFPIYSQIKLNGNLVDSHTIKSASPSQWSSSIVYTTGEFTVQNALTGTIPVTFRIYSGSGSTRDESYSFDLVVDTTPSTLSAYPDPVIIGTSDTYTITPADPDYTHTLTLVYGYNSAVILSGSALTGSWTPSAEWLDYLPDAVSVSAQLVLTSIKDGTPVAQISYPITLAVPASVVPTASISVTPVTSNAWITGKSIYVSGYTQARIQTVAVPGTGASIADIAISGGLGSGSGADFTTPILTDDGSQTATATVTDSRGRTATDSATVSVYDYQPPNINTLAYERGYYSGGSWTQNDLGDDIKITLDLSLSLTAQGNTGALVIAIDGTTIQTATISASGSYSYYYQNLDPDNAHTLEAQMTDSVGNVIPKSVTIPTLAVPFNIHPTLPGAAFGKIAQTAKTLEIAHDWDIVRNGVSAFTPSPVPIANGGTGATNVSDALVNLGLSVETLTITATKTSGSCTIQGCKAYKQGKVVTLEIDIRTSASISAGSVILEATVDSHVPLCYMSTVSFASSYVSAILFRPDGRITIREIIGTIPTNYNVYYSITYIEA